jgi:PAS domain-containing protein
MPMGVYEADVDGVIRWANPALASVLGQAGVDFVGQRLDHVFRTETNGALSALYAEAEATQRVSLVAQTPSGPVSLDIDTVLRRNEDGTAVAFGGIVQSTLQSADAISSGEVATSLEDIRELRRSLEILGEAGKFLSERADGLQPPHIEKAGSSIQKQVARLLSLTDALAPGELAS